ncbi:MAG TPA: NAD(P)-dependent oxidoreductase [Chloroflexota bacterium]|jgi:nucleoside-diphosphate-sugar epimerase|nr:NAD(P)-dependent oxidoreductase [Chloroflexota bacterium]
MKRVLVTGANGFIGRHCLEPLLERGFEVHAVTRASRASSASVHWHTADLLSDDDVRMLVSKVQPSHLLHLAWVTEAGSFWDAPENLQWVRAGITLLNSFVGCGGARITAAGTCAEYDWRFGYCSERMTAVRPDTLYGACKNSLREFAQALDAEMGVSHAWGRVFQPYGPGEDPRKLVPYVIRQLLNEKTATCSSGAQMRDFLYVSDVAGALVALLDSDIDGAVNIGSGHPISIKRLAGMIAAQLDGRTGLAFEDPRPESRQAPLVFADLTRLRDELGWSPAVAIDRGLALTIDSLRGQATQLSSSVPTYATRNRPRRPVAVQAV